MLSQWRGYADDGFGICIGFNRQKLIEVVKKPNHWPTLVSVQYEKSQQIRSLHQIAHDIVGYVKEGALMPPHGTLIAPTSEDEAKRIKESREGLSKRMLNLAYNLYAMKNTAFHEEREWRLLAPYMHTGDSSDPNIYDYAAQRDRIKPFRQFTLTAGDQIFDEVYIGPRNITPEPIVKEFVLKHLQINIKVWRSSATYR